MKPQRSVPGGILTIVGTVFTFISVAFLAICMTIFGGMSSGLNQAFNGYNQNVPLTTSTVIWVVSILVFADAICASVYAFKYNIVGGILAAVAAVALLVMMIVLEYYDPMLIISIILLGVGSIVTFTVKKPIPEKPQPPQGNMPPQGPPPPNNWQQPPQGNNWQQPPQGGWQPPQQNNWQQPPQGNNWQQPPQDNMPPQNNWQQGGNNDPPPQG